MTTTGRVVIPPPRGLGRDTPRRRQAREALARVLWKRDGSRRLPRHAELLAALRACAPRDAWWTCEMSSAGPVYSLPTREWIRALAREIEALGAARVLEVAAGDGFLSRCLARAAPGLDVIAADDGSWTDPRARMSARERRALRDVPVAGLEPGEDVVRLDALRAVRRFRPDVVLVSWAPPGPLVETLLRAPCRWLIDVSTTGDECGRGPRTRRLAEAILAGPVEDLALCRLDTGRRAGGHARVTLYRGGASPREARGRSRPSAVAISLGQ